MSLKAEMWALFAAVILASVAIDLVFQNHRRSEAVTLKQALRWTFIWISLSLMFNAVIYATLGPQKGTEFFTACLIEKSLSVDNLFVFLLIFDYFKIPGRYQPKVLKYGILGAIAMRLVLIFTGVKLL